MPFAEMTLISAAWLKDMPSSAAAIPINVRITSAPLFLLDRNAAGAEIDVYALGLLAVLVELIAQHRDHHDERADGEIKQIAACHCCSPLSGAMVASPRG